MCVARQHERNVQRRRLVEAPRVVRQPDDRRLGAQDQSRNVARPARPVAHADKVELFAANADRRAIVTQHFVAMGDEGGRHIAIVIMIADNGIHAERRAQPRQGFRTRHDIGPIAPCHVVAAEHN